jgi:hypothetical protein
MPASNQVADHALEPVGRNASPIATKVPPLLLILEQALQAVEGIIEAAEAICF